MPKMSMKQIDADEKKIAAELEKNSNESIDKLAKRCHFSRQKVWRIIKKLEKNETIWGYHAIVDYEKLQMKRYILLIKKSHRPVRNLVDTIISREIEQKSTEIGVNILSSEYLHGAFDWHISFTAEDIRDAKKFCEIINRQFPDHISEIQLFEVIFPVKHCNIKNPNKEKLKEFV